MYLAAGRAAHRNSNARKTFEEHPLGLEASRNGRARERAMNEYMSQRGSSCLSGDEHCSCCSHAADAVCARLPLQSWVYAKIPD